MPDKEDEKSIVSIIATLAVMIAIIAAFSQIAYAIPRSDIPQPATPDAAQTSYYRDCLDQGQRALYDDVLVAMYEMRLAVAVPTGLSESDAISCVRAALNDHPEVFWISDWHCDRSDQPRFLFFDFLFDDIDKVIAMAARYETMAEEALREFDPNYNADDTRRKGAMAAYLFQWVCEHVEYVPDDGSGYDQVICGVFDGDGCVCAGYSKAYKYLCDRAGIPCWYVTGRTVDENRDSSHAWNIVSTGGERGNFVDVTWGDNGGDGVNWKWYTGDKDMFEECHFAESLDADDVTSSWSWDR